MIFYNPQIQLRIKTHAAGCPDFAVRPQFKGKLALMGYTLIFAIAKGNQGRSSFSPFFTSALLLPWVIATQQLLSPSSCSFKTIFSP